MFHTTGVIAVTEDPVIRKLLGDILRRRGYRVVGVEAAHAIALIRSGYGTVDLVITNTPVDFMPVADEVPMLYLAAMPDPKIGSIFLAFRTLKKPFLPTDLLALVKELAGTV